MNKVQAENLYWYITKSHIIYYRSDFFSKTLYVQTAINGKGKLNSRYVVERNKKEVLFTDDLDFALRIYNEPPKK